MTAFIPLNFLLQICGKHFKAVPLYFVSIFYRDVDKPECLVVRDQMIFVKSAHTTCLKNSDSKNSIIH